MGLILPKDVREKLDAHLDAVGAALATTEGSRERRRSVVDDLELQIIEMLESRTSEPTLSDLYAILKKLDPPSAYAVSLVPNAPALVPVAAPVVLEQVSPRYSRTALVGLVFIILGLLTPFGDLHDQSQGIFVVFALLGTVLGWVSIYQISHSEGRLRGIYLALFDAFIYAVILGVLYAYVVCVLISRQTTK